MVDALPDGTAKTLARAAAPFVAAYLNERLVEVAPRFVGGIDAIVAGLTRIATHVGTTEMLRINTGDMAVRTITGVRFDTGAAPIAVAFADRGLADLAVATHVTLDSAGRLAIAMHSLPLPYGAVLRLGLDRAIIPSVVPSAADLAGALRALVDCTKLGELVADDVGVGSATLYRTACTTGMLALASEIDDQIAAIDATPIVLAATGSADGVDLDGDRTMDAISAGTWTGTLGAEPIVATFAGTRAP
jgi:hypothetical protein